jgi:hypothetical protein
MNYYYDYIYKDPSFDAIKLIEASLSVLSDEHTVTFYCNKTSHNLSSEFITRDYERIQASCMKPESLLAALGMFRESIRRDSAAVIAEVEAAEAAEYT